MGYRYIGSKARIAEDIITYIGKPSNNGFLIDAFSGTGVVAEIAAENGWSVIINDMMKNAVVMSEARLISSNEIKFEALGGYKNAIDFLNDLPGEQGYFWREYSPASKDIIGIERKYFTEYNASRIDAITHKIHEWKNKSVITEKESILLLSDLISAVNDVANIAGTYGCFLSRWTGQAKNDLKIETSVLRQSDVEYRVRNMDVFELQSSKEDTVYLDPPYTKRQYASYYHILETIVQGDEPKVEGVAGLRPWKEKASVFCYKRKALKALSDLIIQQDAKRVILSYSNEGHVDLEELLDVLKEHGEVKLINLSTIARYTPNKAAVENNSEVNEYIIDFRRKA